MSTTHYEIKIAYESGHIKLNQNICESSSLFWKPQPFWILPFKWIEVLKSSLQETVLLEKSQQLAPARNQFTFRPSNAGSLKHPGGNSSNDRLFYKMKQVKYYLLEFRVLESNETRFLTIVCDDFVLGRVRSIKMQIQTRDLDKWRRRMTWVPVQ